MGRHTQTLGDILAHERWSGVVPVPIRADTTVIIRNVPSDITKSEADKIGRVLLAMAEERP